MSAEDQGEFAQLRIENVQLLDELETAYKSMEALLTQRDYEAQIIYQELRQRAANLQQFNEQLQTSLREKEILLAEVYHRVKNNLQVVSSLLALQVRHIEDKKVRALFNESQNRIKTMALIHEKLHQSEELKSVDVAPYFQSVTTDLFHAYKTDASAVQLQTDINHLLLEIEMATHCGLIVNELVSNALKYAFPSGRKGKITVQLYQEEGEVNLVVADDGIGLPEHIDFSQADTLGLRLVYSLAQQLKGQIKLERDVGTKIKIVFPKPAVDGNKAQ